MRKGLSWVALAGAPAIAVAGRNSYFDDTFTLLEFAPHDGAGVGGN